MDENNIYGQNGSANYPGYQNPAPDPQYQTPYYPPQPPVYQAPPPYYGGYPQYMVDPGESEAKRAEKPFLFSLGNDCKKAPERVYYRRKGNKNENSPDLRRRRRRAGAVFETDPRGGDRIGL